MRCMLVELSRSREVRVYPRRDREQFVPPSPRPASTKKIQEVAFTSHHNARPTKFYQASFAE
ncbi:hypothetical protein PsYK624_131170 [Phanerochaete sordida]|uniref:Uncharacterized protein n=1 Tax=Phanerochaete sordida TaxID=48140 RepID=A0A9P3LJQ2_9APHY|nr:hypothetical protein PsYK624_131170 [Phanerochaete sordida]